MKKRRRTKNKDNKTVRDIFSYDKENNPDIDMCLNCQSRKCNGNCEKIKKARHKKEE